MADGSEDSYLYMKGRAKTFYKLTDGDASSSKLSSSPIPKKASADTKRLPTPDVRHHNLNAAVGHNSPSIVTQATKASTAGPSNYDDHIAFDLYEQDPDMDLCEDYNLRRQSSDFQFNFEDMIVLPIRLKKPSSSFNFDTPPSTDIDEFDYADQHVYYSQLVTTVNSNSAIHEYHARKGPLWDCAWEMLVPKGLHPAYLTESEFVKLVLSQGNDTAKWMDVHIPVLHKRALQKAASARQKLSKAGISPFELTQEYLESFEWMDKIEQDNFVKTMQKLQLQVSFQKQGISMRIEDIDDTTPGDEEKLIGKSHTKLVDGYCVPRNHSSDVDESFMVDKLTLAEFQEQFWYNEAKKASAQLGGMPIQQTHQSPITPNFGDEAVARLKAVVSSITTDLESSEKQPEQIEHHESLENSEYAHQDTKNINIFDNDNLKTCQFPPLETSSHCPSYTLPIKNADTHIIFSLQNPPPLTPTRSAQDGYISDGGGSLNSTIKGSGGHGGRSHVTKSSDGHNHTTKNSSSGSQIQKSGKTEGNGSASSSKLDKLDSIGRKLGSPGSLKKKLSSVWGTIGRSGKRRVLV